MNLPLFIRAFLFYECCPEFGVASAFKADSARKKITPGADSESSAILLIGAFFLFRKSVNMLFYAFVSVFSAAFEKKTALADVFHTFFFSAKFKIQNAKSRVASLRFYIMGAGETRPTFCTLYLSENYKLNNAARGQSCDKAVGCCGETVEFRCFDGVFFFK